MESFITLQLNLLAHVFGSLLKMAWAEFIADHNRFESPGEDQGK